MNSYKVSKIIMTPTYMSDVHELVRVAKMHSVGIRPVGRNAGILAYGQIVCDSELNSLLEYYEQNTINEDEFKKIETYKYSNIASALSYDIDCFEKYQITGDPRKWLDDCPTVDIMFSNYRLMRGLEDGTIKLGSDIYFSHAEEEYVIEVSQQTDGKTNIYEKVVYIRNCEGLSLYDKDEVFIHLNEINCHAYPVDMKTGFSRMNKAVILDVQ